MHPLSHDRQKRPVKEGEILSYPKPPIGILQLHGKDVLDFFHRMSTNDLLQVKIGEGITTILTSEKGRIIDVIDLYLLENEAVIVHSEGTTGHIRALLEKYVIMEDVQINDDRIFGYRLVFKNGEERGKKFVREEQGELHFYSPRISPDAVIIVAEKNMTELPLGQNFQMIEFEHFNSIRLEKGIPLFPYDFNDEVNPLESNLQEFVSWTKGCYIGQEVIARLDTYQKIKRFLKGIIFEETFVDKDVEFVNSNTEKKITLLDASDKQIGEMTSCGYSYNLNTTIALARFERGAEESSNTVFLSLPSKKYAGKIVDLPIIRE